MATDSIAPPSGLLENPSYISASMVKSSFACIQKATGLAPEILLRELQAIASRKHSDHALPRLIEQWRSRTKGDPKKWDRWHVLTLAKLVREANGDLDAMVEALRIAVGSKVYADSSILHPCHLSNAALQKSFQNGDENGYARGYKKTEYKVLLAQDDADDRTLMRWWSKHHPQNPECQSFEALACWMRVPEYRQAVQVEYDLDLDEWAANYVDQDSDRKLAAAINRFLAESSTDAAIDCLSRCF